MKREDLNKIRDKLKIGSKVECKVNTGGDFNSTGAKIRKGVVTEKYDEHFVVQVKVKNGNTWNESFRYEDLIPIDGKVKVIVRKKWNK